MRETRDARTSLIAIILVRNQPWCFQRYPESRCVLARPLKLIDYNTLAACLFSPLVDFSLCPSLFAFLSPADTLPTRAISSVFPPYPFCPPPSRALTGSFTYHGFHAGSHPESGYDSVVLSRFSLREYRPTAFSLSLSRSHILDRSLRWYSASPLTPCPTPPSHPLPLAAPSSIYRARKFRTPQTRGSSRISRVRISPFLAFSLRPYPPSLLPSLTSLLSSLASFGVSRNPLDIYVYSRAFRFNSFRRTRISPPPPPSPPLSPSSLCSLWFRESTFERSVSLSPLYLFLPGSRQTRSPRSFCPVPFHHRCRAAVLPPSPGRPSVLSAAVRPSVSRGSRAPPPSHLQIGRAHV